MEEDVSIYPLSSYLHHGTFSDVTDCLLVVVCAINIYCWIKGQDVVTDGSFTIPSKIRL